MIQLTQKITDLEQEFNNLVDNIDSNWQYIADLAEGRYFLKRLKELEYHLHKEWRNIIQQEFDSNNLRSSKKASNLGKYIESASKIQNIQNRMAGLNITQAQGNNEATVKQAARLINSGLYEEALALLSTAQPREITSKKLYQTLDSLKPRSFTNHIWFSVLMLLLLVLIGLTLYPGLQVMQTAAASNQQTTLTEMPTIVPTETTPLPTAVPTDIPSPTATAEPILGHEFALTLSIKPNLKSEDLPQLNFTNEVFRPFFSQAIKTANAQEPSITLSIGNAISQTIQLKSDSIGDLSINELKPYIQEENQEIRVFSSLPIKEAESVTTLSSGHKVWLLGRDPSQEFYFIGTSKTDEEEPVFGWIAAQAIRQNQTPNKYSDN